MWDVNEELVVKIPIEKLIVILAMKIDWKNGDELDVWLETVRNKTTE